MQPDDALAGLVSRAFAPLPPRHHLLPHQQTGARMMTAKLAAFGGVILADAVGTGKSYIAAAVAQAYAAKGDAVDLLVPKPIIVQWKSLLKDFRIDATVRSHESLLAAARTESRRGGLLIVDEAHRFRNPNSRRYAALAERSRFRDLMLVTATPIWNSLRDLHALLQLIVPDDVLRMSGVPSIEEAFETLDQREIRVLCSELIIRRPAEAVAAPLAHRPARREVVRHQASPEECRLRMLIDRVPFALTGSGSVSRLLRDHLHHRLDSSVHAFLQTVRRQIRFLRRADDLARRGLEVSRREYARLFADPEDREYFQDLLFPEMFLSPAANPATLSVSADLDRLRDLEHVARRCPDAKLLALPALVEQSVRPLLLFTRATATAEAIYSALSSRWRCGLTTSRRLVDADGRRTDLQSLLAAAGEGGIDVLISTDLVAEGVNLQSAVTVIHYDLPWTAVRLEQRTGRAARAGQRASVTAIHLLPRARRSHELRRITAKTRIEQRYYRADDRDRMVAERLLQRTAAGEIEPGVAEVADSLQTSLCAAHGTPVRLVAFRSGGAESWMRIAALLLAGEEEVVTRGSLSEPAASLIRANLLVPPRIPRANLSGRNGKRRPWNRRFRAGVERALASLGENDDAAAEELVQAVDDYECARAAAWRDWMERYRRNQRPAGQHG